MEYNRWITDSIQVVEAVGAGVMVIGGLVVLLQFAVAPLRNQRRSYLRLRRDFGRVLQLGLEILIVADIVRTIVVEPTLGSVAILGSIVLIRILLSWSLDLEVRGAFPWQPRQLPDD